MNVYCSTSVRCGSPLETALADIAAAGFDEIDLLAIDGWVHLNPSDLARDFEPEVVRLESMLEQRGLKLRALNTGVGPQLWDRSPDVAHGRAAQTAALVSLMERHDVPVAAIQPRNPDRSRPYEAVLADCVATLREQVGAGVPAHRQFALELHIHSPFETMEQARMLIDAYPDVPLVYDPTHFVMQGVPIRETGWLMRNAKHAHFRDAARDRMQVPLGEGEVDFDWVLGEMREIGYGGNVSIEYLETDEFDAVEQAQRLRDLIQSR